MTPLKPASLPMGAWIATGRGENSLKVSTAFQKSAFSLSILLRTTSVGRFRARTSCQASSVPTTTPVVALATRSALSATRSAPMTSPEKSWNPGVSSKLTLWSFQVTCAIAVPIEIFRLISSASKSKTVVPASVRPSRSMTPPAKSMASARLVLPSWLCPRSATLRIFSGSNLAIGSPFAEKIVIAGGSGSSVAYGIAASGMISTVAPAGTSLVPGGTITKQFASAIERSTWDP